MSRPRLTLELVSGPLDGHQVVLENEAKWTKEGQGALAFPWDSELGSPQARFFLKGRTWRLEGYDAPHGTYLDMERVKRKVQLGEGDLLKASQTWMLVVSVS